MKVLYSLFLPILPLLWSCQTNGGLKWGMETFGHDEGWNRKVSFNLDLPDSTARFGMDICAQIYGREAVIGNMSLPVAMTFMAPDSTLYCDTLRLPLNVRRDDKHHYNRNGHLITVNWPYREEIVNRKPGRWIVSMEYNGSGSDRLPAENVLAIGVSINMNNK